MAVTITFDDYNEKVFDSATQATQLDTRGPYHLTDDEDNLVALIPDFGVRVVAITE